MISTKTTVAIAVSALLSILTATAHAANPGTVGDLAASATSSTTVTLSFTEVTDGAGLPAKYDVRFAPGTIAWGSAPSVAQGTCTTPLAGTTIGATKSCTVTGLTAGTAYQFQLVAFRGTLNMNAVFGGLSNITGATTPVPDTTAPNVSIGAPPANESVSGPVNVTATATDNVGVAGVQFKLDGNNLGNEDTSAPYAASFNSTSSTNGAHTLSAVARDAAGNTKTASITVTISNTPVTNPGTVTTLGVSGVASTSATLSFTQVNDGTGQPAKYDVRFAPSPISWGSASSVTQGTCSTPLAGTAIGATKSCNVTGLTPSKAYQFQLVAFRGTLNQNAVFGGLSNVASATTSATNPPPPPPPPPPSVIPLFQEGFENGNKGIFGFDADGRTTYTQSGCHSGNWCGVKTLTSNANQQRVYWEKEFGSSSPQFYVSAWWNFEAGYSFAGVPGIPDFGLEHKMLIINVSTGSSGRALAMNLRFQNGELSTHMEGLESNDGVSQFSGFNVPIDGAWHHYEYLVTRSANPSLGNVRVWVDGTLRINKNGGTCPATGCGAITGIQIGAFRNQGNPKVQSFKLDDVIIGECSGGC